MTARWKWTDDIYGFSFNDNTGGSRFWKGRAFLYIFRNVLSCQWLFGKASTLCGMEIGIGGGEDESSFSASIRLPYVFAFYLRVYIPRLFKILPYEQRDTGWRYADGKIWVDLWHTDQEWRKEGHGWQVVLRVSQWIKGKSRYEKKTISEHEAVVQLPDGDYPVKVCLFKAYTYYPRWWTDVWDQARIDMFTPIPVPARGFVAEILGEDEDAIYSMYTPASTLEEALEKVRTSVLRDRARHGD